MKLTVVLCAFCFLAGCSALLSSSHTVSISDKSSMPKSRYEHEHDFGPEKPVDVAHIKDPIPRHEPILKAGNYSPYEVRGKKYRVNFNHKGFKQSGYASWYGKKFHGKRTSNGEVYNMYAMTAAHKTLPIPVYVRVTNKNNKRSVIVRVNDRGPFHSNRIIDLTYTAAKKLGFVNQGTAPVKIEVLDPEDFRHQLAKQGKVQQNLPQPATVEPLSSPQTPRNSAGYDLPEQTYLQAGAYGSLGAAQNVVRQISQMTQLPVKSLPVEGRDLHKVLVGPILDNFELMMIREKIIAAALGEPHVVYAK